MPVRVCFDWSDFPNASDAKISFHLLGRYHIMHAQHYQSIYEAISYRTNALILSILLPVILDSSIFSIQRRHVMTTF